MVFVLKKNAAGESIAAFVKKIEAAGCSTFLSTGTEHTVVCLIGNTAKIDVDFMVQTNDIVEYGRRVTELIAALSLCELFIGTDGGAMHLAVALNKKGLALFENLPAKLNHWYPWQVPNRVVHSPDAARPEISNISQRQVTEQLELLV